MSYVRSVYLHKDKSVFKLDELPVAKFAESLGLPGAPKIKFLSREQAKKQKNASRTVAALQAQIESEKAGVSSSEDDRGESSTTSESDEESEGEAQNQDRTAAPAEGSKPAKVCLFLYAATVRSISTATDYGTDKVRSHV